jgi:hypothetical protein
MWSHKIQSPSDVIVMLVCDAVLLQQNHLTRHHSQYNLATEELTNKNSVTLTFFKVSYLTKEF